MHIQLQNQVSFKQRYPFVNQQNCVAIVKDLESKGIPHKIVGSEILTGKALSTHVKDNILAAKTYIEMDKFELDVKNSIAEFKNYKKTKN